MVVVAVVVMAAAVIGEMFAGRILKRHNQFSFSNMDTLNLKV